MQASHVEALAPCLPLPLPFPIIPSLPPLPFLSLPSPFLSTPRRSTVCAWLFNNDFMTDNNSKAPEAEMVSTTNFRISSKIFYSFYRAMHLSAYARQGRSQEFVLGV